MSEPQNHHLDTLAIHAGQEPDPATGAIMTPIYQTSTFVQSAPGVNKGYDYSRSGNPTRAALESLIAAIESGRYGLAFSSGLAAMDCVLRRLNPGDHVIVGNDVYGGTYRLFERVFARFGLQFSWVDMSDLNAVRAAFTPQTKLLWLETPTNPLLTLFDMRALADAAPNEVLVAVDNTFASPALQQPLTFGADIVMHSSTKYLGGHSDVVGGLLAMNDEVPLQRPQISAKRGWLSPRPDGLFSRHARRQNPRYSHGTPLRQRLANRPFSGRSSRC